MLFRKFAALFVILGSLLTLAACGGLDGGGRGAVPLSQEVTSKLVAMGSSPGAPMMMRIFKQDSVLEVWKQTSSGEFALFKTYNICAWSGGLGPKISEGDRQAPEGFYDITPGLLNAKSSYFLAFNTGFPNKFDRAYGRTGANLMVHGDCSSSGCYAMTDQEIAEIFALIRESLAGGNKTVQLEMFPFHMTADNLAKMSGNANLAFWKNIKVGYDDFETTKKPPHWDVCDKKYVFDADGPGGKPVDAACASPQASSTTAATEPAATEPDSGETTAPAVTPEPEDTAPVVPLPALQRT